MKNPPSFSMVLLAGFCLVISVAKGIADVPTNPQATIALSMAYFCVALLYWLGSSK